MRNRKGKAESAKSPILTGCVVVLMFAKWVGEFSG